MSTTTTNLSLTKPDGTDYVDIDDINGNMDTIDAAVGAVPVATKGSLQAQVNDLGDAVGDVPVSTEGSLQEQVTRLGESISKGALLKAYDDAGGVAAWQTSSDGINIALTYDRSTKVFAVDLEVNGVWIGRKTLTSWF